MEVNQWLSSGSNIQNTQGHISFILAWASKLYVQQHSVLRVRNGQLGVSYYNGAERVQWGITRCYPIGFLDSVSTRGDRSSDHPIPSTGTHASPYIQRRAWGTKTGGFQPRGSRPGLSVPSSWQHQVLLCHVGWRECRNHPLTSLLGVLNRLVMFVATRPSLGEPSRGFVGTQGPPYPEGLMSRPGALCPVALGVSCPDVSCPLCGPTKGVADSALRLWNGKTMQCFCACHPLSD